MKYQGKYPIFDSAKIRRYPLKQRKNKVQLQHLVNPAEVREQDFSLDAKCQHQIEDVAGAGGIRNLRHSLERRGQESGQRRNRIWF